MTNVNAETQTRLKRRHTSSVKIVGPSTRQTSDWVFFLRNSINLGDLGNLMTTSLRKKLGILIFGVALAFSITSTVHASTLLSLRAAFDKDRTQSNVFLITYGTDGDRNDGERSIINSGTLLRMNNAALRHLMRDYIEVRTYDGFSDNQIFYLIRVLRYERATIRRLFNRMSNIRGEKYRIEILEQELELIEGKLKEAIKKALDTQQGESPKRSDLRERDNLKNIRWIFGVMARFTEYRPRRLCKSQSITASIDTIG